MAGLCQLAVPPTVSSPRDGARNPEIRCSSVDLPAPFGPSSPVTPGPIVIVMSLTATTLPYHRETLRSSIAVTTHRPSGTGRPGRPGSHPARSRTSGHTPIPRYGDPEPGPDLCHPATAAPRRER